MILTDEFIISKQSPHTKDSHDYEEIQASYKLPTPGRTAPKPPLEHSHSHSGTLGGHTELDGVPFCINPSLSKQSFEVSVYKKKTFFLSSSNFNIIIFYFNRISVQMPKLKEITLKSDLDYNFQLERQILCTLKSSKAASRLSNPFFR